MRLLMSRRLWCALLLSTVVVGLMRGEPGQDSPEKRIQRLVQQLGHPRFYKRRQATVELDKFGEQALPALRQATKNNDLEIRLRAKQLIAKIMRAACTSKSTGLELVVLQAGNFQMGSPGNERGRQGDELQHRVRLNNPFLIGKHEVTQEQYGKIMQTNPSWFSTTGTGKNQVRGQNTKRYPVENVTWYDAVAFCNRLSKQDGYKPYYKLTDMKRKDGSIIQAKVTALNSNGYRLPTEAEWEYACRAGTTNRFHYGSRTLQRHANLKAVLRRGAYGIRTGWQSLGRTTTVGSYPANPWGLYNMHGNVAEWCGDFYDNNYYIRSPKADPRGPARGVGVHRVVRGGSWLVFEDSCRSASRFWMAPGQNSHATGFRVARTP